MIRPSPSVSTKLRLKRGRDFPLVDPDVEIQIGMRVVDSGIDHAYDDIGAAGRFVPGFWGVDIGVRRRAELADIVETGQRGEVGIVGQ